MQPALKLTNGAEDAGGKGAAPLALAGGISVTAWAAAALLDAAASAAAALAAGVFPAGPTALPAEWLWWCPCPDPLLGVRALVACVPLLTLETTISGGDPQAPAGSRSADARTLNVVRPHHPTHVPMVRRRMVNVGVPGTAAVQRQPSNGRLTVSHH